MSKKPLYIKMWQEVGGKQVGLTVVLSPDVLKDNNVEDCIAYNAVKMHQAIEKYRKEGGEIKSG